MKVFTETFVKICHDRAGSVLRFGARVRRTAVRRHCCRGQHRCTNLSTSRVIPARQRHVVQRRRVAAAVGEAAVISGGSGLVRRLAVRQRSADGRRQLRVCGWQ